MIRDPFRASGSASSCNARRRSSPGEFLPSTKQVIDQTRRLLSVSPLEPSGRAEQSLSVVCAEQYRSIVESSRAELHTGIVADGREISDRWEQSLVMKRLAEQAWELARRG